MTSRLIEFILFPCLIIALLLGLAGVRQIQYGSDYYMFLSDVSRDFNSWSFSIPSIPKIQPIGPGGFNSVGLILAVLIKIGNFFVVMINAFISVLNIITSILNVVIQLIQFCVTLIHRLIYFREAMAS